MSEITEAADRHRNLLVQCGWCPVIMANDGVAISLHFVEVHRATGHSARYIKGTDWDISELSSE